MQNQTDNQPLLACKLNAIAPEDRPAHEAVARHVVQSIQETRELPDGYAFRLPLKTPMLEQTARWIANERLCCPFFTFKLIVGDEFWLELTGGGDVKAFIQANIVRA